MDKDGDKPNALTEEELNEVYSWVDTFELSRPKKNIARDFSDGLQIAEVIKSYYPKLVELHNFPAASNVKHKTGNWNTLNRKVFNRMNFQVLKSDIEDIVNCKQQAVERFQLILRIKVDKYQNYYKDDTTVNLEGQTNDGKMTTDHSNVNTNMGSVNNSNNYYIPEYNDQGYPMNQMQNHYTGDQMMNNMQQGNYNQQMMLQEQHTPNQRNNKGNYPPPGPNKNNQRNNAPNPLQMAGRNNLGLNNNPNMNNGEMMDMQNYNNTAGVNNSGYNKAPSNIGHSNLSKTNGTNNPNFNYKGKKPQELESMIVERDSIILDLKDTVEILELKIKKMEQLQALKDNKINNLLSKMNYM